MLTYLMRRVIAKIDPATGVRSDDQDTDGRTERKGENPALLLAFRT
jgi:hypothetical protein